MANDRISVFEFCKQQNWELIAKSFDAGFRVHGETDTTVKLSFPKIKKGDCICYLQEDLGLQFAHPGRHFPRVAFYLHNVNYHIMIREFYNATVDSRYVELWDGSGEHRYRFMGWPEDTKYHRKNPDLRICRPEDMPHSDDIIPALRNSFRNCWLPDYQTEKNQQLFLPPLQKNGYKIDGDDNHKKQKTGTKSTATTTTQSKKPVKIRRRRQPPRKAKMKNGNRK